MKYASSLAAALFLLARAAHAQTSMDVTQGEIWTPLQWNNWSQTKQDTLGFTPINRANNGSDFTTPAAVPANIGALPHVATLTALQGAAIATYGGAGARLVRDDFASGNGAPALVYEAETGTCSANSRVNDGGSCANITTGSGVGNSWFAVFSGSGDVREWGVKFDNSTDNSTALQSAFNWWALGDTLTCPAAASPALFATGITETLANTPGLHPSFVGAGRNQCLLEYTSSTGTAISVTYQTIYESTLWRDFSLLTNRATSSTTGISLTQTDTTGLGGSGASSVTDFQRVTLRGADGPAQTDYWGVAIADSSVSSINFNVEIWGQAVSLYSTTGTGISLVGTTGSNGPAVQLNLLPGSIIGYTGTGVLVGSNVQGLNINQSNIVFGQYGVYFNTGTCTNQAVITGTSFSQTINSVVDTCGTIGLTISNNFFVYGASNAAGFDYAGSAGQFVFKGNECTNGTGSTGMICAAVNGPTDGGVITANNVFGSPIGFSYGSTASGVKEYGNTFSGVTTTVAMVSGAAVTFGGSRIRGGSAGTTLAANTTGYVGIGMSTSNEAAVGDPADSPGFLYNLQAVSSEPPGSGQSYTITLRASSTSLPLTCTISGASGQTCSDGNMAHGAASTLVVGNIVDAQTVSSASAAAGALFNWSASFASNP